MKKIDFKALVQKISIQNLTLAGLILVIVVIVQMAFPVFLTPKSIDAMFLNYAFEGIIALGMTFIIITGGIDLSVASVFPFAEILVAILMMQLGVPMGVAIGITLVACTMIGVLNGLMVHYLNVNPMVITMAMMLTLRGVNLSITGGSAISGFPEKFLAIGQDKFMGLNIPVLIFLALALILGVLLSQHKFFRQVYFVGGNERAAGISGVNVMTVKVFFYGMSALLAGISGILGAARFGAAQWGHGLNYEIKAITAVAIGGASLYGGSGKIGSTVLGVIFLAVINNAFVMASINTFWQDVVNGSMLILALLVSTFIDYRKKQTELKKRNSVMASS